MERKEYEIAGKKFYQRELVWGQIKWIAEYLVKRKINIKSLTSEALFDLILDDLPRIMAFTLVEEGQTQADKIAAGIEKAEELAVWFEANLTGAIAVEVIADFFVLNKPGLMLERIAQLFHMTTILIGSMKPSASSQMETSQKSRGSLDTLHSENPSLTSIDRQNGG